MLTTIVGAMAMLRQQPLPTNREQLNGYRQLKSNGVRTKLCLCVPLYLDY
jgi:hypothetical protein